MPCNKFTITDSTGSIDLNMPKHSGIDYDLSMNIESFNFVTDDYDIVNRELDSESFTLSGYEYLTEEIVYAACFPLCFPLWLRLSFGMSTTEIFEDFGFLEDAAKKGREITISGISSETDGVYIIKNFNYRYVEKAKNCFEWNLSLEYVRN